MNLKFLNFSLALLVVIGFSSSLFGTETQLGPSKSIGVVTGDLSGKGIVYRVWNDKGVANQIAGGVLYRPDKNWGDRLFLSVAYNRFWSLYERNYFKALETRLFVFGGVSGVLKQVASTPIFDQPTQTEFQQLGFTGGGIGMEIILFKNFLFSLEYPYVLGWDSSVEGGTSQQISIEFRPSFAFQYRF